MRESIRAARPGKTASAFDPAVSSMSLTSFRAIESSKLGEKSPAAMLLPRPAMMV